MITENLSTLKIHKLTQAQYDRELAAGRIDADALYLTPDEEIDTSNFITAEELDVKAEATLSSAKTYTDTATAKIKDDLLNGAGAAYDTLKELGDLIDDNQDAIDALETVASSKVSQTDFDNHTANATAHITSTERTNWNAAKTHADSTHAPSDAEKNQNAFSNIKVGSTTIAADSTTDTFELAGSNVTITPDATNDKVTISVADGSTSVKGVVKLTNSTSSTSTTTAATPSSVKAAYDLANGKLDNNSEINGGTW